MIDAEVAALLESFAEQVVHLPGVSRTNPDAFAEAKSELRGKMRKVAADLRCPAKAAGNVAEIPTGQRFVKSRPVIVVSKSRRS